VVRLKAVVSVFVAGLVLLLVMVLVMLGLLYVSLTPGGLDR
jgi:hypothetical protein